MKIGQRVKHTTYGAGTVIHIENSIKLGDGGTWPRVYQSSLIKQTNGMSRYDGSLNVAIKFDNGGPQGFALNASNDIQELEI